LPGKFNRVLRFLERAYSPFEYVIHLLVFGSNLELPAVVGAHDCIGRFGIAAQQGSLGKEEPCFVGIRRDLHGLLQVSGGFAIAGLSD
jgi:hypothetical protein